MLRKDIEFRDPGPAFTEAQWTDLKAALGVQALPAAYESFMKRFNGADPIVGGASRPAGRSTIVRLWWPVGAPAADSGLWASLSDMYRLGTDPIDRPELLDVHEVIGHLNPPQTLAFCDASGGGNRFLLDLRPDRHGQVLFCSGMARGDDDAVARDPYHNVAWVGDDLVDFLNRLEVEPDDIAAWEAAQPPAADMDWKPE